MTGEGKKDGEEVERRRTKMLQKMGGRARFEWKKETKKKKGNYLEWNQIMGQTVCRKWMRRQEAGRERGRERGGVGDWGGVSGGGGG